MTSNPMNFVNECIRIYNISNGIPAGSAIVTLTGTQILTNKTHTNPVINGTVTTTGLTLPAATFGGNVTLSTKDVVSDTTTGSSFGTAADQKVGWHGSKAVQAAAIPDAAGGAIVDVEARAALNLLLAASRLKGTIAT